MHPETYKNSMEKHYLKDTEITKKELNKVERKLNEHSKDCVKIFKVAEKHGQHKRALKNATVHVNGQLPHLKGNEKDHKKKLEMRPLVNAMDGPKKTVSDIYSDVIAGVVEADNDGTLCSSTEELLATFEAYNNNKVESVEGENKKKKIIG